MSLLRRNIPLLASVAVYAALYVGASLAYHHFCSLRVLINLFEENAPLGLTAVGMTFVILAGGIDLSVGSVMALCSIVIAVLIEQHGWHPLAALALALGLSTLLGTGMGCIIHYLQIAPFIVTLAGMFFARGLALIISVEPVPIRAAGHAWLGGLGIPLTGQLDIPITALVFLGALFVAAYVTVLTPIGRSVYALGGDEEAALLMGLRIGRTKVFVYTVSGFCSGLAGVLFTLYQSAGNPSAGVGMELDAIAAVVVGGTLLTGGVGGVCGTLIGVLIFGTIQTAIIFDGRLSSWWTRVAIGTLLLLFVLLQRALTSATGRRKAQHVSG
ncbi:MAG TPA: sugar ABC transporter permease YjfF [Phycisphaerae bacterium]|nr:sugar ABC transporter permease YjfF [Phycisphaerae bacterium]HNU44128.1 sugar ABC transporter permease YjfF [Phycisphaerae bacterium]